MSDSVAVLESVFRSAEFNFYNVHYRFTHVVGPHGRLPMGPPATAPESPYTPELLRPSPI